LAEDTVVRDEGGALPPAARTSVFPQPGHRAFFPAAAAGAFNFLPQAQITTMELSPATSTPSFFKLLEPEKRIARREQDYTSRT
jgi:hypothetical protein